MVQRVESCQISRPCDFRPGQNLSNLTAFDTEALADSLRPRIRIAGFPCHTAAKNTHTMHFDFHFDAQAYAPKQLAVSNLSLS